MYILKTGDVGLFIAPSAAIIEHVMTTDVGDEEWREVYSQLAAAIALAEAAVPRPMTPRPSPAMPPSKVRLSPSAVQSTESPLSFIRRARLKSAAAAPSNVPEVAQVTLQLPPTPASLVKCPSPGRLRPLGLMAVQPSCDSLTGLGLGSKSDERAVNALRAMPSPIALHREQLRRSSSTFASDAKAVRFSAEDDSNAGSSTPPLSTARKPAGLQRARTRDINTAGLALAMERHAGFMDRRMPTEDDEALLQDKLKRKRSAKKLLAAGITSVMSPQRMSPQRGHGERRPVSQMGITGSTLISAPRQVMANGDGGADGVLGGGRGYSAPGRDDVLTVAHRPFDTAVVESCASLGLSGHVVILADSLRNLRHFILPLRQPSVPCVPIVLLTSLRGVALDKARADWTELAMFPAVYLLDTSGDLELDAPRAALPRASVLIVRSAHQAPAENSGDPLMQATRADSVTILATLQAERVCGSSVHIISEIQQGDTLSQLSTDTVGLAGHADLLDLEQLQRHGASPLDAEGSGAQPLSSASRSRVKLFGRRCSIPDARVLADSDNGPAMTSAERSQTRAKGSSWLPRAVGRSLDPAAESARAVEVTLAEADAETPAVGREYSRRMPTVSNFLQPGHTENETFNSAFDTWVLGPDPTRQVNPLSLEDHPALSDVYGPSIWERDDDDQLGGRASTGNHGQRTGGGHRMPQMATYYASGRVLLADVTDKLSSQAFFNPHILPLMGALLNPSASNAAAARPTETPHSDRTAAQSHSAHLCLIIIPSAFYKYAKDTLATPAPTATTDGVGAGGGMGSPHSSLPRAQPAAESVLSPGAGASAAERALTWGLLWDWMLRELGVVGVATYARVPLSGAGEAPADEPSKSSSEKKRVSSMRRNLSMRSAAEALRSTARPPEAAPEAASTCESSDPSASLSPRGWETSAPPPVDRSLAEPPKRETFVQKINAMRRGSGHTSQSEGSADVTRPRAAGDATPVAFQPYVVTNPSRTQPLRRTDLIFALVPPSMLDDERVVRVHGNQVTKGSVPTVPKAPMARETSHTARGSKERPPPLEVPDIFAANGAAAECMSAPAGTTTDELRREMGRLTAALASERRRSDELVGLLQRALRVPEAAVSTESSSAQPTHIAA